MRAQAESENSLSLYSFFLRMEKKSTTGHGQEYTKNTQRFQISGYQYCKELDKPKNWERCVFFECSSRVHAAESADACPRMSHMCANNFCRAPDPGGRDAGGPTGGRVRSDRRCWSKYRQ